MDSKEAKEIIRAGIAWANWTDEQKKAFILAYESIEKAERYEKALRQIETRSTSMDRIDINRIVKKALKN